VKRPLRYGLAVLLSLLVLSLRVAQAAETEEEGALFASANQALKEGRPGDAIAQFEALADRGVVDAAASFDRGLAYANRVRVGGEQPGDLGQAAQGFEESRELTVDPALEKDATRALTVVRAEVARRRARAGEPVELDQGTPLGRTIVELLPEEAWAIGSAVSSLGLGIALFVRALASARRARIGATIACAVAAPLLALGVVLAVAARSDRLNLREGVIVSASARPADDRGLVLPTQTPLPEGTRVQVIQSKPGWTRVRWGALSSWIPSAAVRVIARTD
jgi:hypothetical protein